MKFLATSLLALLAHGSQATKLSSDQLNAMVKNGQINKDLLLKNSVRAPRSLQNDGYYGSSYNPYQNNYNANYYQNDQNENNNAQQNSGRGQYGYYDEDGQWVAENWDLPFNGEYTVRFNKCMTLTLQDEDIAADDELVYYASSGVIVAQKNYVLFDIQQCEPGNCVFDESDLSAIYMVPLENFVESFIEYFPNKRLDYCTACENHYQYCANVGTFFDQATYRNGGGFCYEGEKYELINCSQCKQMGCFGGADQYYDSWEEVGQWVTEKASCSATGGYWNDYPLYTGLMCNGAGDGVEFGVFVDQECKQYHTQKAFDKVISNDDWTMLYKMPNVIEFMFTSSISCLDENNVQYMNAYQPIYGQDEEDCENMDSINQSCLDLFQENEDGYSLSDCLSLGAGANGRRTEEQNEQQQMSQQDMNKVWKNYGLYQYDLSASTYADSAAVCNLVANKYLGNHQNVYNEEGMFDYNSARNNYYNKDQHDKVVNSWGKRDSGLSVGEKIAFYLLGLGALAVVGLAAIRVYKSQSPTTVETIDKELPLVS